MRPATIIGILTGLFVSAGLLHSQPMDQQPPPQEKERKMDPACDCCLQCEAARRSQRSEDEQKSARKPANGCRECCIKCGMELPMERKAPPEMRQNTPQNQ